MIAISLTQWLRLLKKRILCFFKCAANTIALSKRRRNAYAKKRRLRFFGKRKKALAFITNVKDLRGITNPSVIFFAVLSKSVIWSTAPVQGSPKSASCKRRTIGCELLLVTFVTHESNCLRGMSAKVKKGNL